MKKKVLGLALIAISAFTFSSVAQTQANVKKSATEQSKFNKKQCDKQICNPFEGMNLSDSQKEQLKKLNETRRAQRTEKAKAHKEQQKADRAKRAEARKAEKRAYLQNVKSIIGTENYVTYLENMVINGDRHKGHKGHKAMRDGKKAISKPTTRMGRKASAWKEKASAMAARSRVIHN